MAQQIHIALYRVDKQSNWQPLTQGTFTERRHAENFVECKRDLGFPFEMAVVSGYVSPMLSPTDVEALLGAF
jgi:hypothetical protein